MTEAPEENTRLEAERLAKVERVRARGAEPYPWSFPARVSTVQAREACANLLPGSEDSQELGVAGRLRTIREHGKSTFADIEDGIGSIQLFLTGESMGEGYARTLAELDPGDIVGARGVPAVTKRGEPSIKVRSVELLSKAIHPPPEKHAGVRDPELRLRQRYVELLSSPATRRRFTARSELVRELRRFFDSEGFLEAETSGLVPVAGGAAAAPFCTHSRYLDSELQLRISLELPLKRLLVGGFERVFELGHVYRNEDLDSIHSPEFTMLEAYWAYADYTDMRGLIERLYARLARYAAEHFPELPSAREAPELFQPPFAAIDFGEALEAKMGASGILDLPPKDLAARARASGATIPEDAPAGVSLDKLFEHFVSPTLVRPTFVLDHPQSTTPLAKRHRSKPGRVERFELYCRDVELANAYTELNDPLEQESRFRSQLGGRSEEAYALDTDFVEALRYGMPPATGVGLGVDRAIMFLLGIESIKEILLFPQTRPTRRAAPDDSRPMP
ncbi:MAG TPA: lysine--tRNA ligase [Thermoplasmata archaeon]|nr:lysine--tRNA ligase [Thermoplasmata archaeon]